MAKHVKLAKGASMFYDSGLKLKVLPGQIVKLPHNHMTSKYTMDRLRNGHLQYASDAEVAAMGEPDTDEADTVEETITDISTWNKNQLIERILEEYEYTEAELKPKKKDELIAILTEEDDQEDEGNED